MRHDAPSEMWLCGRAKNGSSASLLMITKLLLIPRGCHRDALSPQLVSFFRLPLEFLRAEGAVERVLRDHPFFNRLPIQHSRDAMRQEDARNRTVFREAPL